MEEEQFLNGKGTQAAYEEINHDIANGNIAVVFGSPETFVPNSMSFCQVVSLLILIWKIKAMPE